MGLRKTTRASPWLCYRIRSHELTRRGARAVTGVQQQLTVR